MSESKSGPIGPLQVFEGLPLPVSVMTEVSAFIGRRGQGKSFASRKFTEQLLKLGAQVIYLDPPGNAHGLRLASDGKGPGFNIPVFGGQHGDIPLDAGSGAAVADLIVDLGISAVLDLSELDEPGQTKLAGDFARQFYQRKKTKRSACTIILEEAQEFVPQNPQPNQTTMLHHFTRMAKIGRNFGIGLCLVTLRPQDVNKKVLDLTELMVAFQMNAPRERAAMKDWMGAKGLDENLLDVLPTLKRGRPYVYSPQLLGFIGEVQVLHTETYDTSATPEFGAASAAPVELTPIELEGIRGTLAATVERLKAEDPKALKAQVARLQAELRKATAAQPAPAPKVERVEVPVLEAGDVARIEAAAGRLDEAAEAIQRLVVDYQASAKELSDLVHAAQARLVAQPAEARARMPQQPVAAPSAPRGGAVAPRRPAVAPARENAPTSANLTRPQQAILNGLAWLESVGIAPALRTQVALLAGASPKSSAFTNNLGALRSAELIDYPGPGTLRLSAAGRAQAHAPDRAPTSEDLQGRLLQQLPRPQANILRVLIAAYPDALSREALALDAEASPTSSAYTNNLGALRSLGLIDYPAPGQVIALPVLFIE